MWKYARTISGRELGSVRGVKRIGTILHWLMALMLMVGMINLLGVGLIRGCQHLRVKEVEAVEYVEPRTLQEHKQAHLYHGVLFAYQEGGKWYFDRDGKRCKLFAYLREGG